VDEFDLIRSHFTHTYDAKLLQQKGVVLGVGDDCAITQLSAQDQLVFSMDTLVAGTHFLPDIDPEDLAWRLVACTVSDLAAMGAEPLWITLALTLPKIDPTWIAPFATGLKCACDQYGLLLIGGDTTKGPLTLTAQVHGKTPKGQAITRAGARVGDDLYVTGTLGDSRLGLELLLKPDQHGLALSKAQTEFALARFLRPTARIEAGQALRPFASSALDISDGVAGDAKHIAKASGVKLIVDAARLPKSHALKPVDEALARSWMLGGGEDFELLFTASPNHRDAIQALSATLDLPITRVGSADVGQGVQISGIGELEIAGYQHFSTHGPSLDQL
jgi:thiamine-monophosphate kinase